MNAQHAILRDSLATAWRAHDRRPIHEWAEDNVTLTTDYAIPGPFRVRKSRYLIEPFRALSDDTVKIVTIQKAVQTGGSLLGDILAMHTLVNRPQNFYWNFPTDDQAKDYAERRVMRLIMDNPLTAARILEARHANRHKVRTVQIIFPNMWLVLQGANEGNLQSHSVPMLINEELWQWAPGMYEHAVGRTAFFEWKKKIVNISQAGEKGGPLDTEFRAGTQEEWEVPCLECRQFQPLIWSEDTGRRTPEGRPIYAGVHWEISEKTKPDGRWFFDALIPTVYYQCAHCEARWPDTASVRAQLNDLGQYKSANPNAPHEQRSFHWNALASPEIAWGSLVVLYLQARDQEQLSNREPIREFWLKRMAVSYDPSFHLNFTILPTIDLGKSTDRPRWPLQEYVFLTVDVQRDHFWALIHAWNSNGQDCVLFAAKLRTWEDIADLQARFEVPNRCVFIDCRYRPNEVYRQCARHGDAEGPAGDAEWVCWTAIMGDARKEFLNKDPETPQRRIRQPFSWPPTFADPCLGLTHDDPERAELTGKFCPVVMFAKGTLDQLSFDRRDLMAAGHTSFLAPGEWNREFSKQMQGEQPEVQTSPLGKEKHTVRRVGPNHLLDCYRMGLTAACMAKIINPMG